MKKFFSTLFVVLFATSMMAQLGLTCEDAIPVGKDYRGYVEANTTVWYTASTYDLPLHVSFSPVVDNSDSWGPEVQIDFTCTPKVYDDPKLDSVINQLSGFGLSLPVEFLCDPVYRNGKTEFDLIIDQSYRERLTEVGITYNVQAYVKVYFEEAGEIRMTPDDSFQSCVENGHFVKLGDTIDIAANDADRIFVLPYSEWQNDSIQFTWVGEQSARVWVAAGECNFTPITTSAYYRAHYDIAQDAPHKLQSSDIKSFMEAHGYGGIYFGKVISSGAGKLVVEKIPLGKIQGDAILLKHGESVSLGANDNRVFCFPKTWQSSEFLATTQYLMGMHVSNTPDFVPGDANVISVYPFSKDDNSRSLQLSNGDITALAASAKDDYLYVRFVCDKATTLTPTLWKNEVCANKSILIQSGEKISLKTASSSTVYRLRYEDWKGYDFSMKWNSYAQLSLYIADECDIMLSSADPHVVWSKTFNPSTTATITAAELDAWASRVDADGMLYVRVNPKNTGNVTFTSDKPADETPVVPEPEYVYESAAVCFGETYEWKGQTLAESGTYTHEETDENGAVTITELTFTVYPQTKGTAEVVEIPFGATYDWNGVTYAESGEYIITLQDEHGCNYQDTLVLTILPEEKPEFEYPVVEESSEEPLLINYSLATQIYGMDQPAWVANDVTLFWSGASPLHIFISKKPDFALAKGHKNVVKYIEVPANGSVVLSKSEIEALSQYKNEGGYLYVRCLSEFEGELTTKQAE